MRAGHQSVVDAVRSRIWRSTSWSCRRQPRETS